MKKTELARHEQDGLVWFTFPELDRLGFLKHWITTRAGGVSEGPYSSLNLADHVGDDPSAVDENRKRAGGILCGGRSAYFPVQTHSADVVEISSPDEPRRECDAVTVRKPEAPIGVLTADCLPIVIADTAQKRGAVVHAGRVGVFKNITGGTVGWIVKEWGSRPENLLAVVGPGIRDCCHEVGDEVFCAPYEEFVKYRDSSGKLDMHRAVEDQLASAGVPKENMFDCGICTSCENDVFYSHRKQDGRAGRFMTGLMLG